MPTMAPVDGPVCLLGRLCLAEPVVAVPDDAVCSGMTEEGVVAVGGVTLSETATFAVPL